MHRWARLLIVPVVALGGLAVLLATRPASAAPTSVQNPSLEQTTNGTPNCFTQGGWGTNTVAWSLVAGHTGTVAQQVVVSGYTNGDRKLMPTENATCAPAVTPGSSYTLSVWYKSTTATNHLTVFTHSAAGWTYWTDLAALPVSANWTQAQANTPVVAAGVDQIAFGISIAGNGTLTTDDYNLTLVGGGGGGGSQLTYDGGLENAGNPPDGWALSGWGDATVNAGVTTDAHGGTRAYQITLSGRTQGDYKLMPTDVKSPAVQPGNIYQLSAWYKSTSPSNSLTVFSHTASGWGYWTDLQTLPPVNAYTQVTANTPAIPAGVDAIAWGISNFGNGTLTTDDYSTLLHSSTTSPTPTPSPTNNPQTQGQWTVMNYQMPVRAMHATLLKNGKILLIAGSGNNVDNFTAGTFTASVYDPVAGTFNTLNVPKDMFCAGHVTLPDGRVLIQGGTKSYPTTPGGADYGGLRDSWIFDPGNNSFTNIGPANDGHWYPTMTEMGNGDMVMEGGLKEDTTGSVASERFNYATGQWMAQNQVPQTFSFWGLYPHMFLMQDGRLFYSGGHVFGNNIPDGSDIYDPVAATIAKVPGLRNPNMRDQSASVLLPPAQDQKVMIAGGGNITTQNPAINTTDLIDLKAPSPSYVPGPDLPGLGKMYLNATTLPDRTVLMTNGGQLNRDNSTNVYTAAVYNPASNAWTPVAADPIGRNYHSTSLLMPDGRVVVFGSNPGDGTFELRISMYQPTYLFGTARPTISATPTTAGYGQNFHFNVGTSGGKTIKWAQLMRPMSMTHQMDSNMRLVDLPVTVSNGVATVSVTTNHNLLPPGPYMLTVTDSAGIPSVASWVTVQ
jgi:hypothetical protein